MFVKFKQTVGRYAPDDIDEFDDGIARGFVDAGQAERSTAGEWMKASQKSEMAAAEARFNAKVEEILAGVNRGAPKGAPNGGGAVDWNKVGQQTPEEEQDKRLTFSEALRCSFVAQCNDAPPALANFCRKRLRAYSDEFTEYKEDPQTGKLSSETHRILADGSHETILRTGTDYTGATYGFTLKPNFIGNLFKLAREATVFEGDCRKIPVTQGNEVIWPMLDQYKAPTVLNGVPQAAIFGGIQMAYGSEISTRPASDAAVDQNRFKIFDLIGSTSYSRDYIVDNYIAMDAENTRNFADAIAWLRDWTYIRGDGIGKPQGYFNANAAITGGPSSGARYNSNEISSDDLSWMISKMLTQSWMRSRWIANVTSFPQLYILLNHSGTPVFQPNAMIDQAMLLSLMKGSSVEEGRLVSAPMGMLLGRPIYFTEKAPILGTTGDISLVDPDMYGDATKEGIEIGVSEHYAFLQDIIWYRFKMRHFGKSIPRAPYIQADNPTTPASGTTVSPFVLLHS